MTAKFSFNNPPLDNIAFLMSKKPELHFDYDEIKFEAHQRAFTIAKITQIDLLADIQTSLENAFVEGQSFEKWKKELKPTLQKHGWLGKVVVQKPNTKEQKEIFVGASRLKKIFYTNAHTAYAQSEARAGYKLPLSEYIRYVAILDNRTRHTHAQMHGKIAHRKDKFWEKNYPPNGWNCRCAVEFISKDEMDEQGFKEMSEIEKTLNFAEKDWDYDTRNLQANYADDLLRIVRNKIKKYQIVKNAAALEALKEHESELIKQKGKEDLINKLDDFEAEKIPPKISKEAFLESGFDEIVNKKEFLGHFKGKPDEESRLAHLHLIEPTKARPNAVLKMLDKNNNELRKAFLKVFESKNKKKFYVFLTDYDNDKIAVSGYPLSEKRKAKSFIRKALEVLDDKK